MADAGDSELFSSASALRELNRSLLDRLIDLEDQDPPPPFLDEIEQFQARAAATGAILSAIEDRSEAQSIVNFWVTILYNGGRHPPATVLAPFDSEAARLRTGDTAPYKGLEPFQVEDSNCFFGRHAAVKEMLDKLAETRLIAVVGLSGSGKSSAVRAGLIPKLREGAVPGSGKWLVLDPVVPGDSPIEALGELLQAAKLTRKPVAQPEDLTAALDRAGTPVLLSIDQFEELFTLGASEAERNLYVDALVHAATAGNYPHIVLITMRSEYDTRVEKHPRFAELFAFGRIQIGALSTSELRAAIEQPAAQVGVGFAPGLSQELVERVLGEPAGLPLLQFTLLELWKRRSKDNQLTWECYLELGGSPREILADRADTVYDSFQTVEDQTLSRRIFTAVVQLGSGLDPTARRVRRFDLDRLGPRDNVDRVLGIWQQNGLIRILPSGAIKPSSQVEVAHEALIRNWSRFRDWIKEAFSDTGRRRTLTIRAAAWQQGKESLLGELSLEEAETYELTDEEREYVNASRNHIDRSKRRIRHQKQLGFAAAVAGLLLLVLSLVFSYRQEAKAYAARAEMNKQSAEFAERQASFSRRYTRVRATARAMERRAKTAEDTARALEVATAELRRTLERDRSQHRIMVRRTQIAREQTQLAEAVRDQAVQAGDQEIQRILAVQDRLQDQSSVLQARIDEFRPAIALQDGWAGSLPRMWRVLERFQANTNRQSRSVGRLIDSNGEQRGTAFMVADRIALVPRAALVSVDTSEAERNLRDQDVVGLVIDFRRQPDDDRRRHFPIIELVGVVRSDDPYAEMALVRLAERNELRERPPPPLDLAEIDLEIEAGAISFANPNDQTLHQGRVLQVIGYPIRRSTTPSDYNMSNATEQLPVLRMSPGFLLDIASEGGGVHLLYDNTTFMGSGGSPVIDMRADVVVGIHIGGDPADKYGIPLTRAFFQSPVVRNLGIRHVRVLRRPPDQ